MAAARRTAAIARALAPAPAAAPARAAAVEAEAGSWVRPTTGLFVDDYSHLPAPHPADEQGALFRDIDTYGYCIIANTLSPAETSALAARVAEQAQLESESGYIDGAGSRQNISTLTNKGKEFRDLLDHPKVMPAIEHIVGAEMQLSITNAIIVKPSGEPMPLHHDQWWMPQPQRRTKPMRIPVGSVDREKAHTDDWKAEHEPGQLPEFIAPPVAAQAIFCASEFAKGNGATMVVP